PLNSGFEPWTPRTDPQGCMKAIRGFAGTCFSGMVHPGPTDGLGTPLDCVTAVKPRSPLRRRAGAGRRRDDAEPHGGTPMSWSWGLGRMAGIDVYVHFTFLLLLGWVALAHFKEHGAPAGALRGVVFILALFGIVVLHDLRHALVARRYGIRTRDITLLPI